MIGTLSDKQILASCKSGALVSKNFIRDNIKQCCYELRAGDTYYDLSSETPSKKIIIGRTDYILIKPHHTVVIITKEELNIQSNIVGRILSKGALFSLGLLPVNTYADPGFRGKIGLVFHNSSKNYLKIKPLQSIAKIEFSYINESVEIPYDGQHGFNSEIWPVRLDMILSPEEIKNDKRILSPIDELSQTYGNAFSDIVRRVSIIEKSFVLSSIIFFILMLLLIATIVNEEKIPTMISLLVGLVANIIYALLVFSFTKIKS